jgi:hypothetical protein
VKRLTPTFVITFAAAYAILYVFAVMYNLALFTYHPATEEFYPLVKKAIEGPAMYWYGWIATSAIGAFMAAAVASLVPIQWAKRLWSGWSWAVPLSVMLVFSYLLRGYFTR